MDSYVLESALFGGQKDLVNASGGSTHICIEERLLALEPGQMRLEQRRLHVRLEGISGPCGAAGFDTDVTPGARTDFKGTNTR